MTVPEAPTTLVKCCQRVILTACLVMGPAATALAQRADVSGLITDQSGAVLPGVTITVVNEDAGIKRETVTNEFGRFALLLLPAGRSTLTATLSGFAPHEIDDMFLSGGDRMSLVIRMDLAKLGESVIVVALSPLASIPIAARAVVVSPPVVPTLRSFSAVERPRLEDRGSGIPTSLIGTYIRKKELVVYPFLEYSRNRNLEYNPGELGFEGNEEFRGKHRASEALLFVAYGLTDDLAVEFEAARVAASLEKAASDPSNMPASIEESGLGDVAAQLRWRWSRETANRPELFSYTEIGIPRRDKPLSGASDWELTLGTGLIRGFRWGTMTVRGAIQYVAGPAHQVDVGEYAVEYLKQLAPAWRVYAGLEGTQDELSLVGELQWHPTRNIAIKINNGFGLTSKAADWAPEVGVLFRFGPR